MLEERRRQGINALRIFRIKELRIFRTIKPQTMMAFLSNFTENSGLSLVRGMSDVQMNALKEAR